jgi:hypothetical protein
MKAMTNDDPSVSEDPNARAGEGCRPDDPFVEVRYLANLGESHCVCDGAHGRRALILASNRANLRATRILAPIKSGRLRPTLPENLFKKIIREKGPISAIFSCSSY